MSTKRLSRWRKQAAKGWPGPGRPGHPVAAWREALRRVGRVLRKLGWRHGLGTVLGELARQGLDVPTRLVRRALAAWKRRHRQRKQRRIEAARVQVRVLARDAVWSQDAMHLDGRGGDATWGRVVMDRCTREHPALALSGAPSSQSSVEILERVRVDTGRVPLVLAVDNGSENKGALVRWAREHQVVLLYNQPHTPQHNGAGERSVGELREELGELEGLVDGPVEGAALPLQGPVLELGGGSPEAAELYRERLSQAWWRLDHLWPRPCLGGRTAAEVAALARPAYDRVCRARFYAACCCAKKDAVRGVRRKRARRRAEREAVWCVLEEHGLVIRRRGSAPWPSPKTDRVS